MFGDSEEETVTSSGYVRDCGAPGFPGSYGGLCTKTWNSPPPPDSHCYDQTCSQEVPDCILSVPPSFCKGPSKEYL